MPVQLGVMFDFVLVLLSWGSLPTELGPTLRRVVSRGWTAMRTRGMMPALAIARCSGSDRALHDAIAHVHLQVHGQTTYVIS